MTEVMVDRRSREQPARGLAYFVVGGLFTAIGLSAASTYAEARGRDSNEKTQQIALDATGQYPAPAAELPDEFFEQNQHTIDLGQWEHQLRIASGAVLVLTIGGAAGFGAGTAYAERQRSQAE